MNKLLIKLSGLFVMVFSAVNLFVFIGIHFTIPYTILSDYINCYLILLAIAIISFICLIGGIIFLRYKDLKEEDLAKKNKSIFAWSLFFLFFCPISGILGFIVYFSSFKHFPSSSRIEYIEELKNLERLLNEGYITEDEFKLKKKKILNI